MKGKGGRGKTGTLKEADWPGVESETETKKKRRGVKVVYGILVFPSCCDLRILSTTRDWDMGQYFRTADGNRNPAVNPLWPLTCPTVRLPQASTD